MPAGAIPRLDRASVDAFALRGLDAEHLAREIEVELELARARRAEEVEHLAQIAVRMKSVAIADEIALRHHAVNRGADHQKRAVELAAVERYESRVVVEERPELLEDLLFRSGDVRSLSRFFAAQLRLAVNFVHRARAPVVE